MMLQACCSPDDQVQSSASDRLQRAAVRGCGLPRTCSAECAALFNTMFPACFSSIISKTLPEAEAQQWRDFSALCEQTDMAAKNALISRGVDPAADAVCRGSYETMSEARRRTSNSGCGCDGEDGVQRSSGHCLDFDTNCQCDGGGGQLPGKWFRVSGDAGDSIALTDSGMHRCGTAYGGWLSGWAGPHVTGFHWTSRGVGPPGDYDVPGSLPPVASGQVAATVCFSGNGGCVCCALVTVLVRSFESHFSRLATHATTKWRRVVLACRYGCYYRQAVHVVNCGAYALFRLPEIPACATGNHLGYCTAEVLPGTFVGGGD